MERKLLNAGSIKLIDKMGNDYRVLEAARISTGAQTIKGDEKDRKLIRYLYKNKHLGPFEHVMFTFYIKAPIFVMRQWMRHRTWKFNESSSRYKQLSSDTFYPESFRVQDTKNKQGSIDVDVNNNDYFSLIDDFGKSYSASREIYEKLLEENIAREQARAIMPVGQYTELYATIDLRNLFSFLTLRLDSHAQYEIRVYAEAILSILKEIDEIKWSVEIFEDYNKLEQDFYENYINKLD